MKFTAVLGLQTGTGALVARLMDGKKLKVATVGICHYWATYPKE
jgi:hypothetical protein